MEDNRKDDVSGAPKVDISKSTLSVNAAVFVPRSFAPAPPQQVISYENAFGGDEPQYRFHGTALDRIKQAERTLIANPGSLDDILKPLTDSLTTAISNEKTLISVTEEIFNQCVAESNFRYTGARLCNHLSHHLSVVFQNGNFTQQLLKRCREEHTKRNELAKDPAKREHFHGFMLYMAELLINMTNQNGERIPVFSVAVKELIATLLDHANDHSLKAVVQVLKLSGQYLEPELDEAPASGVRPLDEVFAKIDALLQEETLNRSVRNMLESVITLRSKEWGRKDPLNSPGVIPYAANNPYAHHNPYADMPPMDDGGGFGNHIPGAMPGYLGHHAAPTEYSPYLNNGGGYYGDDSSSSGSEVFWSPPPPPQAPSNHNTYYTYGNGYDGDFHPQQQQDNFDDEMASAFEEFLLETGQVPQHHHQ